MGLIKAIAGAAGGVMADQWKEYFYCEAMPANILATKGHKKVTGRSSNYKGDENIITTETINGVQIITIHGSTPTFGRKGLDLGGEYEFVAPHTDLRAGVGYSQLNRESTLMYPYVKGQKLHFTKIYASLIRTFGLWELTLAADYRLGGFTEREKRFETPGVQPGEYPGQLTAYYDYENEYLTAKRLGAALGLRRNIKRFYIDVFARYEHGFGLEYVAQPNRVAATLSVGYNF